MVESAARTDEKRKYIDAYTDPRYGMGSKRFEDASEELRNCPYRSSYLDVGCGRGEMLRYARNNLKVAYVRGVECVPELAKEFNVVEGDATDLPFDNNSFELVTMFDVLEHLLPGDDELACKELQRVGLKMVVITACNLSHIFRGVELHINRRPYDEWDGLIRQWFDEAKTVTGPIPAARFPNAVWRIAL